MLKGETAIVKKYLQYRFAPSQRLVSRAVRVCGCRGGILPPSLGGERRRARLYVC